MLEPHVTKAMENATRMENYRTPQQRQPGFLGERRINAQQQQRVRYHAVWEYSHRFILILVPIRGLYSRPQWYGVVVTMQTGNKNVTPAWDLSLNKFTGNRTDDTFPPQWQGGAAGSYLCLLDSFLRSSAPKKNRLLCFLRHFCEFVAVLLLVPSSSFTSENMERPRLN